MAVVGVVFLLTVGAFLSSDVAAQDGERFGQLGDAIGDLELPPNRPGQADVALSADGDRSAVGDGRALRILDWDGAAWSRAAASEIVLDEGRVVAVAMSPDGETIALTSPWIEDAFLLPEGGEPPALAEVFAWDGSDWARKGDAILSEAGPNDPGFGLAVAISADGDRLATTGPESGSVTIFEWNGSDWTALGDPISADHPRALAISADGNRLAVSTEELVEVHEWAGDAWTQLGRAGDLLDRRSTEGMFGRSVALTPDGSRLAAGCGCGGAAVRVLEWDETEWVRVGNDAVGDGRDFFGWDVDIAGDGDRLAVKSAGNERVDRVGFVQVFDWDGADWQQTLGTIDITPGAGYFGSVALSADGSTIAHLTTDGSRTGTVRLFGEGVVAVTTTSVPPVTSTDPPVTSVEATPPSPTDPATSTALNPTLPNTGPHHGTTSGAMWIAATITIGGAAMLLIRRRARDA